VFLNDALCYTILNKYGGLALSFDTLLIKPISSLNHFFARCTEDSLESHPMSITHHHPIFEDLFEAMGKNFNINDSSSIGSKLVTSVTKEQCEVIKCFFKL
jgi:mannosyltransferase OCH1-like enzyme